MTIPVGDAVALTRQLVRIDSRNPRLAADGPGEGACAAALAEVLTAWGFDSVALQTVEGTRANVIARAGPRSVAPLVMNGHLDVVGVDQMVHAPFDPALRDGRLYGRGACDMKAGVAAMCAAVARAAQADRLAREVWIAAVADEEWQSAGTAALLGAWRSGAAGVPCPAVWPVAAVVTEPTSLAICPAHKGFEWFRVTFVGRAAHGSRHDIGVDAIRQAGLLLAVLHELESDVLPRRTHPLLGRPSLHAAEIAGGSGLSTYPDRCVLTIERRTLPGESPADVLAELESCVQRVCALDPTVRATIERIGGQLPSDVDVQSPVVQSLSNALRASDQPIAVAGMTAWTDAALFNEAGIPAVCFGPGDIGLAHAAEEWVPIAEIEQATLVLEQLVATHVPPAS
jgi:acetylornithine deacetylase